MKALHNAASNGDTITLPAGTFTWSTPVTISKAIKLQGAGSGRIIARSTSSVAVGTGLKTFTTQSGLSISNGQTLRVAQLGNRTNYMEGTATRYSGTTLVLNVTSTGGSGTHKVWWIATMPYTIITHAVASGPSIVLRESTAGKLELSGIKVVYGSGNLIPVVAINVVSGGKPVLIHDCWFQLSSSDVMIRTSSHRGVIWNCSFDAQWVSPGQVCTGLQLTNPTDSTGSWTSNSTMGTQDTSGTNNLYVEDCDFHAFLNCVDFADGSRTVMRHCLFNNAGLGSHGPDSAIYGNRHFEVYDNTFVFNGFSDGTTLNLNWWLFLRGGTGVWTDNVIPAINSQDYPNQNTYRFTVMALRRSGSMRPKYACWSGGYPLPREIGQGYINGSPSTEPVYIWNNTGTASQTSTLTDISCADPEACPNCATQPTTGSFLLPGRDYFIGTPKPGYIKYTYPHPLRAPTPPKTASATPGSPQNVEEKKQKSKNRGQ
ncbi:MAG TPA: hypothetical protein VGL91_01695 [Acidobacteriota bacterium]